MYKGKYEQNPTPAAPNAAKVPAQQNNPAPANRPAPQRRPGGPRKQAQSVTTGTYVFYGVYLAIILVFFIGIAIAMGALKNWLITFQAAQPETRSQQIFQQLFDNPDWSNIYTIAHPDADPKVAQAYEDFMTDLVGSDKLTFVETSGGLSGKKYIVCHNNVGIATFTLTADDLNADVPDWQLGEIKVYFNYRSPNLSYNIVALPGCTVKVNETVLNEEHVIRTISTRAEEYLPTGVHGFRLLEYRISGLDETPEVVVTDATGAQVEVAFDEATKTYTQVMGEAPTITADDAEYQAVLGAAKAWTEYMIKGGTAGLKKYYDTSSQAYKNIVTGEIFRQSFTSYSFAPEQITEYYRYSDTLFSAKIKLDCTVIRKADGYNKLFTVDTTYIFQKTNGKWMVYDTTNVDIQEQNAEVRITYKDADGKVLNSAFVASDAKFMKAPTVEIPEGKVFAGWYEETVDERGNVTLTPRFQSDATGSINLAGVETLEPMTLVARFEDAQEEG